MFKDHNILNIEVLYITRNTRLAWDKTSLSNEIIIIIYIPLSWSCVLWRIGTYDSSYSNLFRYESFAYSPFYNNATPWPIFQVLLSRVRNVNENGNFQIEIPQCSLLLVSCKPNQIDYTIMRCIKHEIGTVRVSCCGKTSFSVWFVKRQRKIKTIMVFKFKHNNE